MLSSLLRRYSLKLIFVSSLLLGIQLPNFLQQYETRLHAHLIEAEQQLTKYQALADLFFSGDISALIAKHKQSTVPLFAAESIIIEELVVHVSELQAQQKALQANLLGRLFFLSSQFNKPLFNETKASYHADIVLNRDALTVGIIFSLFFTLFVELVFIFIASIMRRKKKQTKFT